MAQVHRICPQCGSNVRLEDRFCPQCGFDTRQDLPVARSNVPATLGRAALPVAAGLAGLAVRMGWKLLRGYLASAGRSQTVSVPSSTALARKPAPPQALPDRPRRPRRTIRIRSTWAIGDANGVWQQGAQEHIIEIEDD